MNGLNYMPADSTRAAIKNRGLRHHPDGSSSKNYSVSEVRTGDLFKFKKYLFWRATVIGSDTLLNTIGIRLGAASPARPVHTPTADMGDCIGMSVSCHGTKSLRDSPLRG